MALRNYRRRIGITGIQNSGKTVFLTSLINHLKEHDPAFMQLGGGRVKISNFSTNAVEGSRNPFNYDKYRDRLVTHGEWPEKTGDVSYFNCSFKRSDWKYTDIDLEFFDFPGERVADAAMMSMEDYSEWSKYVIGSLDSESEYRRHALKFLDMQKMDKADSDSLLNEYKLTLANLILNYKPLITPSTFVFGVEGDMAAGTTPEAIASTRYCGKNREEQFVPLSEKLQSAEPKLARQYRRNYRKYRKEVVLPIFEYLKNCHKLIVLLDITTILASETGMFNDNKNMMEDLLDVLDPGSDIFKKTAAIFASIIPGWKPGGIKRVAFVASKADKVLPADRDNLLSLLKQVIMKKAQEIEGLRTLFSTCSALISTIEIRGKDSYLRGKPMFYKGKQLSDKNEIKFKVSRVPEEWPAEWKVKDFIFPDLYPAMPVRRDTPPRQFQLGSILEFVLNEGWFE